MEKTPGQHLISRVLTTYITDSGLFLKKLSLDNGVNIFLKPNKGINGKGCFGYGGSELTKEQLKLIESDVYLIQEKIEQHEALNKLYPHSINTIRVNTIWKGNNPKVLSSLLRFGVNNRQVDNGGAFINIKDGILKGPAYRFLEFGGDELYLHPDTMVELENFKIPYYKDALNLAIKCAKEFPGGIMGWDIAISKDGPVVIEGNHNPHLGMADITYKGLKNNKDFNELFLKSTGS